MKKMRRLLLVVSALFFFVTGCGGYHVKCYPGPEMNKSGIVTITTDDSMLRIVNLDRQSIELNTFWEYVNAIFVYGFHPRTITVLPGAHSLMPCLDLYDSTVCANSLLDIEAKAGDSYIIKHTYIGSKNVSFSIEPNKD